MAAVAALATIGSPVQAAQFLLTFSGTGSAFDGAGIFGPENGALVDLPVVLTGLFDTSRGQSFAISEGFAIGGGNGPGETSQSPFLSLSLQVGTTVHALDASRLAFYAQSESSFSGVQLAFFLYENARLITEPGFSGRQDDDILFTVSGRDPFLTDLAIGTPVDTGPSNNRFGNLEFVLRQGTSFAELERQTSGDAFFSRFTISPAPLTPAIPEPGTWALFIAGFGLCGFAVRRHRAQANA
ncbi:MAG: PEPxxWA-CTERM sorting domain-containing protein [Sandaracinobacteroides sp.]